MERWHFFGACAIAASLIASTLLFTQMPAKDEWAIVPVIVHPDAPANAFLWLCYAFAFCYAFDWAATHSI